jgi:hypothetical protein
MNALCYLRVKTCGSANCMLVEEEKQKLNLQMLSLKNDKMFQVSKQCKSKANIALNCFCKHINSYVTIEGCILLTKCRQSLWLYCTKSS